ncbi:hypothetical protein TNCV_5024901 [Trichonephila clavipes]|nr:hypothetical protein TNCV_5024901 [Trichonephila clavipes]
MQDGRCFVILHKQVARVLHHSRTRIETDGRTRGQRRQVGIQNVKDDIGSHQFLLLRHDGILFVSRQHMFVLNETRLSNRLTNSYTLERPSRAPTSTSLK